MVEVVEEDMVGVIVYSVSISEQEAHHQVGLGETRAA